MSTFCEFGTPQRPCPHPPLPGSFICQDHAGFFGADLTLPAAPPAARPAQCTRGVRRKICSYTAVDISPVSPGQFSCLIHMTHAERREMEEIAARKYAAAHPGARFCRFMRSNSFCCAVNLEKYPPGDLYCSRHKNHPYREELAELSIPGISSVPGLSVPGVASVDSPPEQKYCPICLEDFEQEGGADRTFVLIRLARGKSELPEKAALLTSCGHLYCLGCLGQYFRLEIAESRIPLRCPEEGCRQPQTHSFLSSLLSEEELDSLHKAELKAAVSADSKFVHCARPDCPGLAEVVPPLKNFVCPLCKLELCATCRLAPHPGGCNVPLEPEVAAYAAEKGAKRCPQCRALVERTEGCNNMKCRCGTNFCYICEQKISSEKPYDHFNKDHPIFGTAQKEPAKKPVTRIKQPARTTRIVAPAIVTQAREVKVVAEPQNRVVKATQEARKILFPGQPAQPVRVAQLQAELDEARRREQERLPRLEEERILGEKNRRQLLRQAAARREEENPE